MKILSINKQKGFTLVEIIATIVIMGVVSAMTITYFGKSFLKETKVESVSNLGRALGLQAVMEAIAQDYTRNYAGSDSALSTLKSKIGSINSTQNNKYGNYKVIYNDFIKFNMSGTTGTETSSTCGMCEKNLLKVTIQQVDTLERLTALFSSGGASGSGGCCGGGGGGGCGGGGGGGMGDTTPPAVGSTNPSNGATEVAVTSAISVTFSETMDSSTINTTTFSVKKTSDGSPVTGTVTGSGATYTFTPSSSLEAGTNYTVTITTGVKDSAGNALSGNYTWSFTTASGGGGDTTPPTVSSTCPTSGQTGVYRGSRIKATFSEAMDSTTINTAFTVKKTSDGSSIAGSVSYSGNTYTFTPSSTLPGSINITATITTGAKDLAGNPMSGNYTWSFTTSSSQMGMNSCP